MNITINGDRTREQTETFRILLSNPVNASISDGTGTRQLVNDDLFGFARDAADDNDPAVSIKVTPNPANNLVNVQLYGYKGDITIQLQVWKGKY